MKRVFLINFSSSILIEAAKHLRDEGIEIVYWQGYRDDFDALARTKAGFEKTIFRHQFDAIKNIPPPGIDVATFEPLDFELVRKMEEYAVPALSMIARADHANPPFVKRRNVYYEYMKFWHNMLKKLKPDAVVFIAIPHAASSFVLYGLAKVLGVETIMFARSTIDSRILTYSDYKLCSTELAAEYERTRSTECSVQDLSDDIRGYYENQQRLHAGDSADEQYEHLQSRNNPMPIRVPSAGAVVRHMLNFTFFRMFKSYLAMLFSKRMMHYYDRDFTGLAMMIKTRKWSRMRKAFKREYYSLQRAPDFTKKYVYVPLAYQPEQTTCPSGDIFDDQLLMIDMLTSCIPDDWELYIKEHLPQWYPHMTESHLYRYEGYYRAIAAKKNVRLIPAETNPSQLIKNAQAVATVTGTTGWEAVCRGVPVLLFGYVWYMYCDGVFRISNAVECASAIAKIRDGYRVDERHVVSYLAALDKVSIKAKHYKSRHYIQNKEVSREENVRNITNALRRALITNTMV